MITSTLHLRQGWIVFAFCSALALSMGGLATFPAIVPVLRDEWNLSNTSAGWIIGSYQIGYMLVVALLASLTDRMDAKRILIGSCAVSALASAAFAWLADGIWPAVACQIAGGAALAGIYMPGLKGLADRVTGPRQGRYISFYTASFTVGTSLGFVMAGAAMRFWGWRAAFVAAALAQCLGLALVAMMVPATPAEHHAPPVDAALGGSLLVRLRRRFEPVVRSRETMRYIWGYGAHTWELFALRAWMVPFLAFTSSREGTGTAWSAPAIAAFVTVLGVPASIGGQEAASRIGSRRLIVRVMVIAAILSATVGWTTTLPFWMAVVGCSLYSIAISADSAPLTAAAIAAAPAGHRGAAMAVHSTVGFTAAAAGTLAVGAALDALGDNTIGWGVAFAVMGCVGIGGAWKLSGR
jgi:MFS family permease